MFFLIILSFLTIIKQSTSLICYECSSCDYNILPGIKQCEPGTHFCGVLYGEVKSHASHDPTALLVRGCGHSLELEASQVDWEQVQRRQCEAVTSGYSPKGDVTLCKVMYCKGDKCNKWKAAEVKQSKKIFSGSVTKICFLYIFYILFVVNMSRYYLLS